MGCDIHAYIEYKKPKFEREFWWCLSELHIGRNYRLFALAATVRMNSPFAVVHQIEEVFRKHNIPLDAPESFFEGMSEETSASFQRDLEKCDGDTGITMGQEPFQPKGIPSTLSHHVEWKYTLYVNEDGDETDEYSCSRKSAEGWVESGVSEWCDEEKHRVTHPDWHTPSWLSTAEVEELVKRMETAQRLTIPAAKKQQQELLAAAPDSERWQDWSFFDPMKDDSLMEIRSILAMMKGIEVSGGEARLVFWFDN
jgi:hypothetical protein